MRRFGRTVWTTSAALLGFAVGFVSTLVPYLGFRTFDLPFLAEQVPLPHHVPEHRGGVSFRFAMLHDVIHERFPKHGPAHYQERNRLVREKLSELAPDDPVAFELSDDLAAGLERLGNPDQAVEVMRKKLQLQEARGLSGRALYTSYANLGTFLIHASFPKAIAGNQAAREHFREGLKYVKQSVDVNPEAHFGRERWQASIAEFLLNAMNDPKLLLYSDCLRHKLDIGIEDMVDKVYLRRPPQGRPYNRNFVESGKDKMKTLLDAGQRLDNPNVWPELEFLRDFITPVDGSRDNEVGIGFDSPMMGIIGMWRQGGGANPHFALAVGETMLRVGQRYLAWAAYERASKLADRYWPDPALQEFLRIHCQRRQAEIEATFARDKETVADLRSRFEAELAHGQGYQRAYQDYEAAKIAEGVPINDPHFFDEFHAGREPIASTVGPEEWYVWVPQSRVHEYGQKRALAWGLFGAGLTAMMIALFLRWRSKSGEIAKLAQTN